MNNNVIFKRIHFKNFKAFEKYTVWLGQMNILVGPNNCGKSTIVNAFRTLSVAMRRARSKKADILTGHENNKVGYELQLNTIPISLENVHTNYNEEPTSINFYIKGNKKLVLFFPSEGGCHLIAENDGSLITKPKDFKKYFPFIITNVPVLGPLEHEEELKDISTVERGLMTHRASRHFRSFWYYFSENFEHFSDLVSATWPGMEISKPEIVDILSMKLAMFCTENRMTRELYWAGFGFQIWCQILTHISRSNKSNLIVIDEPEIYLHPDIQRQLLNILRDANPNVIIATHSTEIIGEADPSEIITVDKNINKSQRLKDIKQVQMAMDTIGSIQNITLTQLARSRKILFIEGKNDFLIIRKFANILGYHDLAAGIDITPVESGGFESWEKVKDFAWGIERALDKSINIAAIYDRDFWPKEKLDEIKRELSIHISFVYFLDFKEIENYLLDIDTTYKCCSEKAKRRKKTITVEEFKTIIADITEQMRHDTISQYTNKRIEHFKHTGIDGATTSKIVLKWFEQEWKDLQRRLRIISGKDFISKLNRSLQEKYSFSVTISSLLNKFNQHSVPREMSHLISEIENYRNKRKT